MVRSNQPRASARRRMGIGYACRRSGMSYLCAPAVLALGLSSALAQSTGPSAGNAGLALRNGYPSGGGAVSLPALGNPSTAQTVNGTASGSAAGTQPGNAGLVTGAGENGTVSSGGSGGGGGFGRSGSRGASGSVSSSAGSGSGAGSSSGRSGSGGRSLVVCPPPGSGALAEFFTGTDLACAP